jgi:hypothetical protein
MADHVEKLPTGELQALHAQLAPSGPPLLLALGDECPPALHPADQSVPFQSVQCLNDRPAAEPVLLGQRGLAGYDSARWQFPGLDLAPQDVR